MGVVSNHKNQLVNYGSFIKVKTVGLPRLCLYRSTTVNNQTDMSGQLY